MGDTDAAIKRVVLVISYATLGLFFWFVGSGMMKLTGVVLPHYHLRMVELFRKYHWLLFRGKQDSFDDTSLRVLYGVSEVFVGVMLLSRLDAEATYAAAIMKVPEVFLRALMKKSIWPPSILLWVIFTMIILRRELKRLLATKQQSLNTSKQSTRPSGAKETPVDTKKRS
mmetsp:Transcript_7673/g.23231  ORF Transcript_7673/g.23231 Transcript_7673/m.23231 type:complete len:170 (+) Transcript_7673:134-643(+)